MSADQAALIGVGFIGVVSILFCFLGIAMISLGIELGALLCWIFAWLGAWVIHSVDVGAEGE